MKAKFRSVAYSHTTITELMIPAYANFGGKIHGGIILSLMDKVAYACAAKHSRGYSVTVSVSNVNFIAPIEVGDLVSLTASVNYVGKSSMVIGIRVDAENCLTGEITHANSSYFTMVAMEEDRTPRSVPGLILETKDDVLKFVQAMRYRKSRFELQEEFDQYKSNINLSEELNTGLLEGQNCMVIDL